MSYTITYLPRAVKELSAITSKERDRVQAAIAALADNPKPPGSIQLTGSIERRLRVGNYRVVYDVDDIDLVITIVAVGHRRDIYR